jgi:hypothetical protein
MDLAYVSLRIPLKGDKGILLAQLADHIFKPKGYINE